MKSNIENLVDAINELDHDVSAVLKIIMATVKGSDMGDALRKELTEQLNDLAAIIGIHI